MSELLEKLASLSHEQWMGWAKNIEQTGLHEARRIRWHQLYVPYEELSEEMKECDRVEARKVLKILCTFGANGGPEGIGDDGCLCEFCRGYKQC